MSTSKASKRILVADDNPGVLQAARELLEADGHEWVSARSGIEALCRISECQPDMVFIDKECPRLNGFHVCALVKEREEYRHLPVIVLAESDDVFDQARAEALGVRRILLKPFSREELLTVIGEEKAAGGHEA